MTFFIGLTTGLVVGALLGVVAMCLLQMNKED